MIAASIFGTLPDGRDVQLFELVNDRGHRVSISEFGAAVTAICVPDRDGQLQNVVAAYENLEGYLCDSCYFGAAIGRVANRTANARFQLNGVEYPLAANNAQHHLHGGVVGFNKRLWAGEARVLDSGEPSVTMRYTSLDGEEGYPGNLDVVITYIWTHDSQLRIEYLAETDQETPVNLTNHSYFNLAGCGNVLDHQVYIAADHYTPTTPALVPSGAIAPVAGLAEDFTELKRIGEDLHRLHSDPKGYDHNYVLRKQGREFSLAAKVVEPSSGRALQVLTSEPGVQFYTGNFLDGSATGPGGVAYHQYSAFCLETQHFPDALNQASFPSIVLHPGERYTSTTVYAFKTA